MAKFDKSKGLNDSHESTQFKAEVVKSKIFVAEIGKTAKIWQKEVESSNQNSKNQVMVAIKPTRDFTNNTRTSFTATNKKAKEAAALTVERFKENQCKSMGIGIGPRHHGECPFGVTAEEYSATGNSALETAISSAYKQVMGNANPTDSQRCKELESQLRDGRITTRDFVAGLAKSEFY
eukprot:CAMPEP_0175975434 /NCGR_PEP_ID=MMETSP0108-20121206/43936_1 /TAXON_ID=195067 ORGANISM="Goniomonas pacifica, Strain CCMP1869" /NCGR_SAMPLE_ID=MMETSP0108 /ASSEMBLY_ACC=CAM_ASM_000204 /LENGTH=178 /DNA_ID=CAMNT_0017305169 /DNA_START=1 /DNA_END=535 /DNA_ORIENTATION=+